MTIDLPSKVQLYGWRPSGVLNRGRTPQCTKISSCTCASCSRTFAVSRWPFVFRFSNFIQLLNLKYDETKMTRHHCSFVESTFIVSTTWVRTINKVLYIQELAVGSGGSDPPTHPPTRCVTRVQTEAQRRNRGAAHPSRLECAVGPREASGYKGVGEGVELLDLAVRVSRRRCRSSRSRLSCDRAMWPTTSKLSASRK